jgi:UDP-2,4-diacetamido-2,4,6-trideoxy-beta-L-altropyranose hydrolase
MMAMVGIRIVIRTDANETIGSGHFMRCMTLADELSQHGVDICFVSRSLPLHLQQMLHARGLKYFALPKPLKPHDLDELTHAKWLQTSQAQDAEQTLSLLDEKIYDWLIVDHYALDHRFEKLLRKACHHILVIDDLADRIHDCDVLLDQNFQKVSVNRYDKKVPPHCQLLLGPKYALLRNEFQVARRKAQIRKGEIQHILIFFGGVDAKNMTSMALQVLVESKTNVKVDVVIGPLHPEKKHIEQFCDAHGFACHIQTAAIADLMLHSDLAIGAGGMAVWERLCLGLPSVCIATADNQFQQLLDLHCAGYVLATTEIEDSKENAKVFLMNTIQQLTESSQTLSDLSQRGMTLVEGSGVKKVIEVLKAQMLHLRLAHTHDSPRIFNWRNHPTIRNNSSNHEVIDWNEHQTWFDNRLKNNLGPLLIGEIRTEPIGVVRFDIHQSNAEVSIYLVPDADLRGWGRLLLEQAEFWLKDHHPEVNKLYAKVLPNNEASKRLFAKMQYSANEKSLPLEFVKEIETSI